MAEISCLEDLLTIQRKEKKELLAKTQKLKHGVPKGDKKKKKEINIEIAEMLAALELKHEEEVKNFEVNAQSEGELDDKLEVSDQTDLQGEASLLKDSVPNEDIDPNAINDSHKESNPKLVPKLSKAQKRRIKKAASEKERNEAIAAQELENLKGLRHIESEEIKGKLLERNLAVHEVPSDGNCLYKAVEHQLLSLNLKKTTVQALRELTSNYMLSHMEDYIPFLTNSETGDVLNEEQYVKYCEDIVKTSSWGGHIEIQVLSHVCDVPIEVIQAKGPSIFAGNENCNPKLILCYHRHVYGLGEHYNSVVPASEQIQNKADE